MNKINNFYCYNIKQAQFFISEGANLIEVDIHKKTRKTYFVFNRKEIFPCLFDAWCKRNK